jgi:hypothetical protein
MLRNGFCGQTSYIIANTMREQRSELFPAQSEWLIVLLTKMKGGM